MARKRKYQNEPDPIVQKKIAKGQPKRKRRKLNHNQSKNDNKIEKEETPKPFIANKDEIDIPSSNLSFLQKLDPSELSTIPSRSVRKNPRSKTKDEIPDYEKKARSTLDWDNDPSKLPTRSAETGKLEKEKINSTSSSLLKQAQQRVKEKVKLRDQKQQMEGENEKKKMSAAKQKRKEEARLSNQIKEISSKSIDLSRVPELLRLGWKNAQISSASLQFYLQQVKEYIASLASTIIEDPQRNCKILLDLEIVCKYYPRFHSRSSNEPFEDQIKPTKEVSVLFTTIRKLGILSLVAVLKDITPGYRVRNDNDDIRTQTLKKSVRDLRIFEYAILSSYSRFIEFIEHQLQQKKLIGVCISGLCELLNSNTNFNYREKLLQLIVPFMNAEDFQLASICIKSIIHLFENDELGEASQEAVRLIMHYIKQNSYNVRPEMVDCFLKLKFTQDLTNSLKGGLSGNNKLSHKTYNKLSGLKKKMHKQEKQLEKDLIETAAEENKKLITHYQAEILKSIFSLYFRVLKMESRVSLLDPVLRGLAKFAHLINLEFQNDLFKALRQLMSYSDCSVQTILQCAITAFENLQMHGGTIDIDLKDFYERVYEVLLDVPKEIDCIPNLLHCIRLMISNNRNLDINRVAAYCKRLSTICFGLPTSAALAVIITIQRLIQTFPGIRQLLDPVEDKSAARYNAFVHQPDICNALATSLWEFSLLEAHYHPTVSERSAATAEGQGTQLIPLEVLSQFDTSKGGFNPSIPKAKPHPFEQVIKNAPNSRCYLSNYPKHSKISELLTPENTTENENIFRDYYKSEKQFEIQLEREELNQKLNHYKLLLSKYLEYEPK